MASVWIVCGWVERRYVCSVRHNNDGYARPRGCGSNSITNTYHACSALIREFYGAINFGRCGSHVDQTDTYPYHTTKDERLSEQHLCCLYSEFAQCNTTRDEQIQF